MKRLVFPESLFSYLRDGLFHDTSIESCAVLFLGKSVDEDRTHYLVREIVLAPPEAYTERTASAAELKSTFVATLVSRARKTGLTICFVHTHVGLSTSAPEFSWVDDQGEQRLLPMLELRTGTREHLALVMSRNGMAARIMGTPHHVEVRRVGSRVVSASFRSLAEDSRARYDRQIRAFGQDGQYVLAHQTVAIVGVGGTGSHVAQALAYLGVENLVLVDYDTVAETNLNRLVGATHADIGNLKTAVAADYIRHINPRAHVRIISGDVTQGSVGRALRHVDFVFGCTDSHGSRAVLNQLAYQYLVPVIDMGVSLGGPERGALRITGRVQMLAPGLGCMVCGDLLDYDQVRWDLMNETEKRADPYFIGPGEPAPAVISINGTVASLAVTMFLSAVLGIGSNARLQIYDGSRGTVRAAQISPVGGCVVCSMAGSFARGDSVELLHRMD